MSRASHGLPGVLGEIADLVGIEAALAVAEMVGGTRVWIGRHPGADQWLVRAIGIEKALVIVDHLTTGSTGVEIEFPIGPRGSHNRELRQRARRLASLTSEGLPNAKVARQVGITERAVRMFKARQRERGDDPQGDLGL